MRLIELIEARNIKLLILLVKSKMINWNHLIICKKWLN